MAEQGTRSRGFWFFAVVAAQLLLLGAYVVWRFYVLQTGQMVLLQTMPVDPRDLIRGDYIWLRYEISELDLDRVQSDRAEYRDRERIYVVVERGDPHWQVVRISSTRPQVTGPDQAFLQATVQWQYPDDRVLFVEYGIESFFVPEGQGRPIEEAREPLDVFVVVDRFGMPTIQQVYFRGEPLGPEPGRGRP